MTICPKFVTFKMSWLLFTTHYICPYLQNYYWQTICEFKNGVASGHNKLGHPQYFEAHLLMIWFLIYIWSSIFFFCNSSSITSPAEFLPGASTRQGW